MAEWTKLKVQDIGRIVTGKTPKTAERDNYGGSIPFITPSDDMDAKYIKTTDKTLTRKGADSVRGSIIPSESVCVSCIGSDLGKVVITTEESVTNQQINSIIVNKDRFDVDYIYYAMCLLGKEMNYHSKTSTAVPIINKTQFSQYDVLCPSLDKQREIAHVLSVIDDTIITNCRVNDNLLKQAELIFSKEFLSSDEDTHNGWRKSSLLEIADYLNGLAMQKYRPDESEEGIPVLKIKELRQGYCDSNSDLCSTTIKPEYIVNDGDVIFSWSGSLLVDFWCGGVCGLNQHLFKVSSSKYDKWFYYSWTKHYLNRFVSIAADMATTMGHIKREELAKAEVMIPSSSDYNRIGALLAPLYDLVIANRIENRMLKNTRDTLLPKLMLNQISN